MYEFITVNCKIIFLINIIILPQYFYKYHKHKHYHFCHYNIIFILNKSIIHIFHNHHHFGHNYNIIILIIVIIIIFPVFSNDYILYFILYFSWSCTISNCSSRCPVKRFVILSSSQNCALLNKLYIYLFFFVNSVHLASSPRIMNHPTPTPAPFPLFPSTSSTCLLF